MSIEGIDRPLVTEWLDREIDELDGPYEFELITGGRSNLTFLGTDASGTEFVLRRPTTGASG